MAITSIIAFEYCAISVCAWLYKIKESVIVIRVRCGELNSRLKSGIPNHVIDVSRVKGTSTSRYIRRRAYYRERIEEDKVGQLHSNAAVLQAEWQPAVWYIAT